MKFRSSMEQDYKMIARWIEEDIFHHGKMTADWWIPNPDNPGSSYYICVEDDIGCVIFMRIDPENDLFRLHAQFAPVEEVSVLRTAKCIFRTVDALEKEFKKQCKGLILQSVNEPLIQFMLKKGFKPCGNDDYILQLGEN
jgi:hypothetical protein